MSEPIASGGRGMKLHTKILLGLVVGAVLGVTANLWLGGNHAVVVWTNKYLATPVGQIFLRMLFMIVVPLVFVSITLGVAGLGDLRKVGRVGGKAIGYFLVTTAIAATIGLVAVNIFRPGAQLDPAVASRLRETYAQDASSKVQAAATSNFGIETIINFFPRNPVKAMVDLDLLAIITFAFLFGMALTMITTERARPVVAFFEGVNDVVIKIVEFAMRFAPYGVTALIFGVTSRFGFELLKPLATYLFVVLGALVLHGVFVNALLLRTLIGISPRLFFSRIRSSIVTAFSTSSSSATLPTNLAVIEKNLGVPNSIAGFVLPIGSTMCMNGTALFEGITVLFLAQVFGQSLDLGQQVVVIIMSVLTAVGAAGVPGGSIPLLVGILAMFGVPGDGIAIILGIDRILDMSRTTVNVIGDLCATTWVAKSEGLWTPASVPPGFEAVEAQATAHLDESPENPPLTTIK